MNAKSELVMRQSEFGGLIGVARETVHVPEGMYTRLWGSSTHDLATGMHKPLFATAMAFAPEDRKSELVLLTLDHSWWRSNAEENETRAFILRETGLHETQLILHVSHTHSAPSTSSSLANRPGGHLIAGYLEHIKQTCVQVVMRARAALQPSTLTWAMGSCRLAVNRNLRSPRDGTVVVGLNPTVPADDTVLVGRVCSASGNVRAVLVNYACHPVTLGARNKLVSPDYVGAMREVIERETGAEACLFLHGASGEMTPRRSYEEDVSFADQNGRELGYAALAAISSMFPAGEYLEYQGDEASGAPLAIWQPRHSAPNAAIGARSAHVGLETVDFPSREEIEQSIANCREPFMLERLSRLRLQRENVGDEKVSQFPFLVWQLGDAFIVSTPGEAYSSFQIELRRRFPEAKVAVLNIANGALSYLPPDEDFRAGAYQAKVALYKSGSAERVLEAVTNTVVSLAAESSAGASRRSTEFGVGGSAIQVARGPAS